MKIQIDIPNDINKNLKLYKIYRNFETLQEGVLDILNKFFKNPNWIDEDESH